MTDNDVLTVLELLDPTRSDPPPPADSLRYDAIRKAARRAAEGVTAASLGPDVTGEPRCAQVTARRRRGPIVAVGTFVLIVAFVSIAVAMVTTTRGEENPAVLLAQAGQQLSDVDSLRATIELEYPGGDGATVHLEVAGENRRVEHVSDGCCAPPEIETVVNGVRYHTTFDGTTAEPLDDGQLLDPFGDASAAVLSALLAEVETVRLGEEIIRGVETAHYRLEVRNAAETRVADLPDSTTGWFGLALDDDFWRGVVLVDVWVGDEPVVHRLRISTNLPQTESFVADYFDFNTPIQIDPPRGVEPAR